MHPQIEPDIVKNISIYFLWKNVQLCSCSVQLGQIKKEMYSKWGTQQLLLTMKEYIAKQRYQIFFLFLSIHECDTAKSNLCEYRP